jgi:hypothetical protein
MRCQYSVKNPKSLISFHVSSFVRIEQECLGIKGNGKTVTTRFCLLFCMITIYKVASEDLV